MLGKTANGLFWMYRYLERAENTARLIETGQRIALTRLKEDDEEWKSILQSAGVLNEFNAQGSEISKDAAIDWMLRSKDNPSSVLTCISAARQNARLVRTAVTNEVWEAVNTAYMRAKDTLSRKVSERDLPGALSVVRRNTSLVRGMTHGTMLRNEEYDFARLGTFLERCDNTARILDVKYYVLLPSAYSVGGPLDNVQWESLLRSLSALGGFRMEYGSEAGSREIAQFLILDSRMPRSIAFCLGKLRDNLTYLSEDDETPAPALQMANTFRETCLSQSIDTILETGLHEFLQDILDKTATLARQIEIDYRFYD